MNARAEYIARTVCTFKNEILPALAEENGAVMEKFGFDEHQILPVEIALIKIFDVSWASRVKAGNNLPRYSDYQKDIIEFSSQLMNLWPDDTLTKLGLTIRPGKSSTPLTRRTYKFSHV